MQNRLRGCSSSPDLPMINQPLAHHDADDEQEHDHLALSEAGTDDESEGKSQNNQKIRESPVSVFQISA